ncbi:citrate/2-methylcitrate synthase [Candidatus Actinomarina]|nr:citrate/2-methylcitrate synthase [Candidatus Actinomarina sp.]
MEFSPGLRGVVAGETAISTVGKEGTSLRYRGYDAIELTKNNTYEDVASLIIKDSLDGDEFKEAFSKHYNNKAFKDETLSKYIENLKSMHPLREMHPMALLRTIVSGGEEMESDTEIESIARISATVCFAIASYHKADTNILSDKYLVASSLLPNDANDEMLEALDDMLILYAEHGFNASTFATRVTASTRADLTGAIVSGIATLKGELHGGANERAVELINSFHTVDEAEKGIYSLLDEKKKIMGFGHGVYKVQDPRSPVVKNWVEQLVDNDFSKNRFEIAKKIDEIMDTEKNLFPNVDFYGGLLLAELGFEIDLFTPIFVAGRSVGWAAHYFEQREQDILIRPAAKYIGPSER